MAAHPRSIGLVIADDYLSAETIRMKVKEWVVHVISKEYIPNMSANPSESRSSSSDSSAVPLETETQEPSARKAQTLISRGKDRTA
jgi:hypothetical protein